MDQFINHSDKIDQILREYVIDWKISSITGVSNSLDTSNQDYKYGGADSWGTSDNYSLDGMWGGICALARKQSEDYIENFIGKSINAGGETLTIDKLSC